MELDQIFSSLSRGSEEAVAPRQSAEQLKKLHAAFEERHQFKPGDLIQWKAGMRNKRYPNYGDPVAVTQIYAEPIFGPAEKTYGTPYFMEPNDMKVGCVDDENDFLEYMVDSRRFEPYTG